MNKNNINNGDWGKLRRKVLSYYHNVCVCCGKSEEDGVILHIDHIYAKSNYPSLKYSFCNMQILCESCNTKKSNLWYKDYRSDILEGYSEQKRAQIKYNMRKLENEVKIINNLRGLKDKYRSRNGRLTKKSKKKVREEQKIFRDNLFSARVMINE